MKKKNADSLSIQYHQLIELAKAIETESFSGELQSKNQCPTRFLPYVKSLKNSGFDNPDIFERITPIEKTKKERNKDIPGIQYYPIDFMIMIERKQYLSKDTKKRNQETEQWLLSIRKLLNSVKENIEILRREIESTVAEIDAEYKASQPPQMQDNPPLSPEDSIRKILVNFIVLAYCSDTYPPPATLAKPDISRGIYALNRKMIVFGFGELLKSKDFDMTQEMYDNIAHGYPLDKFSSLLQRRIDIHVNALRFTGWTFPTAWPRCIEWDAKTCIDRANLALSELNGFRSIIAAPPAAPAFNTGADTDAPQPAADLTTKKPITLDVPAKDCVGFLTAESETYTLRICRVESNQEIKSFPLTRGQFSALCEAWREAKGDRTSAPVNVTLPGKEPKNRTMRTKIRSLASFQGVPLVENNTGNVAVKIRLDEGTLSRIRHLSFQADPESIERE